MHPYLFNLDRKTLFDVNQWKTTMYHTGQTHKLAKELPQRLKAVINQNWNEGDLHLE